MDIDRLHRELARAILDADEAATRDTAAFVRAFAAKLDVKSKLTDDQTKELEAWMERGMAGVRAGIGLAVAIGGRAGTMTDELAAALAEEAYTRTWADGKRLSKRLWDWRKDTKAGVADALAKGIRQMQDVSKTLYDLQRAIEKETGTRFEIVSRNQISWVAELEKSARALIHDPEAKGQWNATVADLEKHIDKLRVTGTKRAAERVLDQMKRAVKKGNEKLVGKAVEWWIYDKQLYCLTRIVRTEMADAGHRAIIESTQDSEDVIGYQWRLSASHPVFDICDFYADIEMGLGKGVWKKGSEPKHKAHPFCLCLIVPRVSKVKESGSADYAEFVKNAPEGQQANLLPKWAREAVASGTPLKDLLRADGLGLVGRAEFSKLQPKIAGILSDEFKTACTAVLDKIPPHLLDAFKKGGGEVVLCERLTIARPDLKGKHPRGWPKGKTWDNAEGCGGKSIYAAEWYKNPYTNKWEKNARVEFVIGHEFGHGIDAAMSYPSTVDWFKSAYTKDVEALAADARDTLNYFLQRGDAGPSETFAELMAHKLGVSPRDMKQFFPNTLEAFEREIFSKQNT